jgi:hypothetical protein
MSPKFTSCFSGLVLWLGFQTISSAASQAISSYEPVQLTVRTYSFAKIEDYTLRRAEKVTSAILQRAGVKIAWIECPRNEAEVAQFPACIPALGPTDLVLKLVARFDMKGSGLKKSVFGICLGNSIIISCARLLDLETSSERTSDEIIGLTTAHEIGHALLGSNSHSSRGIMRPHWDSGDLQKEGRHSTFFTEEQVEKIHQKQVAQEKILE